MGVVSLFSKRQRVERPKSNFSIPAALARHYRNISWLLAILLIGAAMGWVHERNQRMAEAAKTPPILTAMITPDFQLLKVLSRDDMPAEAWVNVARAAAASFVVRMRDIQRPIDFTLDALDEAAYHILAASPAEAKFRAFLASKPFDEIVKLNGKRSVMFHNIYAEPKPGTDPTGDPVLISVKWTETLEANGVYSKRSTQRQAEILIRRISNLDPRTALYNPLGAFVEDFEGDLNLKATKDDLSSY